MDKKINTHNMVVDFGQHKGELYTRIPVGYLRWMANSNHSKGSIAEAELKRRGTVMPRFDISGHAIDRASLRCEDIWKADRNEGEGIHSWLCRRAGECVELIEGGKLGNVNVRYRGMKFVFEICEKWPVLKTVMKEEKAKQICMKKNL